MIGLLGAVTPTTWVIVVVCVGLLALSVILTVDDHRKGR